MRTEWDRWRTVPSTEWLLSIWWHHLPSSLTLAPPGLTSVSSADLRPAFAPTLSPSSLTYGAFVLKDPAQILPPSQMLFGSWGILLRARQLSLTASVATFAFLSLGPVYISPSRVNPSRAWTTQCTSASCTGLPPATSALSAVLSEQLMLKLLAFKFLLSLAFLQFVGTRIQLNEIPTTARGGVIILFWKVSTSIRHV